MTVQARAQAMLALVDSDRDRRRAAILDDARQRAQAMLGDARHKARASMRATFEDARRQHQEQVDAAQARLQTRRRMAEQARARALLGEAWQRLPAALQRQWQDGAGRRAWVAHMLEIGQQKLAPGVWHITCAADWPEAERREAAALAGPRVELQFDDDPKIAAGLRIRVGGAVIDGTLDGLLTERAEISARLLAAMETGA